MKEELRSAYDEEVLVSGLLGNLRVSRTRSNMAKGNIVISY